MLQAIGDIGALQIGARHVKAEIDEHLGNAGHADSSDAYKMDVLNSSKHCYRALVFVLSSSIMSTAAAAESPCANFLLASSMRFRTSGAFTSFSISVASRSPVKSCCRIIRAAPAASRASAFLRW